MRSPGASSSNANRSTFLVTMIAAFVLLLAGSLSAQQIALPNQLQPSVALRAEALESARRLVELDKFKQAQVALQGYLATDELSARAHYLLAYTLLRQKKPTGALAEYAQAAQLEPPSGDDLRSVADAYFLLNDLADADRWMSIAVRMDPADPNSWYGLGRIRYSRQRYSDAAACFQWTLALAPHSAKAENNLGLAYEELYRTDDAVRAYRQAIAWQDENVSVDSEKTREQPMLNLASVLMNRTHDQEALALLTRAASLAPDNPKIHEQLGRLYLAQSRLAEAQREFTTALSLTPNDFSLHFFLGQVYHRQGLSEQASVQFARCSALELSRSK